MHAFSSRLFSTIVAVCWTMAAASDEVSGRLRVIDGDTFDVGETRVRLFGIDAPEQEQTCTSDEGAVWFCGTWVSAEVRRRYEAANARCEVLDVDRYGRAVARCFVADADVARMLVRDGLAFAYRDYSMDYDLEEKSAAIRAVGLHGNRVQSPARFREGQQVTPEAPEGACRIKGNISSKGARIYHLPDQRDYANTSIRADQGERWFCSEAEARAAGWRAARH